MRPEAGVVAVLCEETSWPGFRRACEVLGYRAANLGQADGSPSWCELDWTLPAADLAEQVTTRLGPVAGVVSCIEQATVTMAEVATLLGVAVSHPDLHRVLRDKAAMKQVWLAAGVRTPARTVVSALRELDVDGIALPAVVKPLSGAASAAVRLARTPDELRECVRRVLRFNVSTLGRQPGAVGGVIVEEYVPGAEFAVDSVWHDGVPVRCGILSKGAPQGPAFPDRLYCTDPCLDDATAAALVALAHAAVRAVGLRQGATHVELRLGVDGTPYVIEAASRPGAGGALYDVYERALGPGFYEDLVRASVPGATRVPRVAAAAPRPAAKAYWYNAGYRAHGVIRRLEVPVGFHDRFPEVEHVSWRKRPGDFLTPEGDSLSYLAWFDGTLPGAMSLDDAQERLALAERELVVSCDR